MDSPLLVDNQTQARIAEAKAKELEHLLALAKLGVLPPGCSTLPSSTFIKKRATDVNVSSSVGDHLPLQTTKAKRPRKPRAPAQDPVQGNDVLTAVRDKVVQLFQAEKKDGALAFVNGNIRTKGTRGIGGSIRVTPESPGTTIVCADGTHILARRGGPTPAAQPDALMVTAALINALCRVRSLQRRAAQPITSVPILVR